MKRIIAGIVAGLVLVAVTGCDTNTAGNKPTTAHATTNAKHKGGGSKSTASKGPKETAAQANARASAQQYLDTSPFSRKGLIDQLKFGGFSVADATYGADSVHADWNKEAVLAAKQYLNTAPFSHSALVDQLKFGGFTPAQAEYGVKGAGL